VASTPRLLDERIVADLDRHIADAAQAIDETISGPEDEDGLIGACEAIVVARERIDALRAAVKRSSAITARSVELRKEAARQLYESIKARRDRNAPERPASHVPTLVDSREARHGAGGVCSARDEAKGRVDHVPPEVEESLQEADAGGDGGLDGSAA
jgi:hypothetical protein